MVKPMSGFLLSLRKQLKSLLHLTRFLSTFKIMSKTMYQLAVLLSVLY